MTHMAITFDTLKYVENLKAAGVPEKQAKAMSTAQQEVFSEVLHTTLATKDDLREVRQELKHEIADIRSELKLMKWMMGFLLSGVISIVIKTFFIS